MVGDGEFQRRLDRFRAAVGEVRSCRRLHRHDRVQFFRELRHVTVVVVSAADVNQLRRLILNRFDDFRMTMSGRTHGHTGVAIEKDVAVNVFDPHALGSLGDELE